LWLTNTGERLWSLEECSDRHHALAVAFAPHGETLLLCRDGAILSGPPTGDEPFRRVEFKVQSRFSQLVVSPDAQLLASIPDWWASTRGDNTSAPRIDLCSVATGKNLRSLLGHKDTIKLALFTPDSRLLLSADSEAVHFWEAATGRELRRTALPEQMTCAAFSPDGRVLAWGDWSGVVRLWEVATGKERRVFSGHAGCINSLAFSPDGRLLATASEDTTVLVWDVAAAPRPQPPATLSAKDLQALWADLGGDDASRAYRAIYALAAVPGASVPFLRQRLRPVPVPDPGRIARLVADLDSGQFSVRKQASLELEKLGVLAERALREKLAAGPSLEVRRRIEPLLRKLDPLNVTGEQLQALRAVEVLESAGRAEAETLLEALAQGAPPQG
jgi:hypothetical protein